MGDPERHNPEELFLASLSSCHMLWFLHLCSVNDVLVEEYVDSAEGTMTESDDGSGRFTSVTLKPMVMVAEKSMLQKIDALHQEANQKCFIANSCNFSILHQPSAKVKL